jgi:hypothetical protein
MVACVDWTAVAIMVLDFGGGAVVKASGASRELVGGRRVWAVDRVESLVFS